MTDGKEVNLKPVPVQATLDSTKGKDQDVDSGSGSETGEKPVREKLKKTDLEEVEGQTETAAEAINGHATTGSVKLKKKRSFKDLVPEDDAELATTTDGAHARKKTREARSIADLGKAAKSAEVEVVGGEDGEAKHSDAESDRIIITPQSSEDEAMAETTGTSKIKKKRSSDEMLGSQDVLRSPKVAATNAERERRSSSAPLSEDEATTKSKPVISNEPPRSVPSSSESTSEAAAVPSTNGFANTSTVSPFASSASKQSKQPDKQELPQTSASAFAGSGFAALSNSASAFGTLTKSSSSTDENKPTTSSSAFAGSGFASLTGTASPFGTASGAKKPISSFAASKGDVPAVSTFSASPFAATGNKSAFGGPSTPFGSGFGGGFGGSSKLTSFAAPVGDTKSTKPAATSTFGAPENKDAESDDGEGNGSEHETGEPEAEKTSFGGPAAEESARYKIRANQSTGEEGELTWFHAPNAKLYQAVSGSWAERGKGPFKLNYKVAGMTDVLDPEPISISELAEVVGDDLKLDARFIMRNAATHKVIINARIFKEMTIGDKDGKAPIERTSDIFFSGVSETGGLNLYLLRVGKKDSVNDLYDQVKKIQAVQ